MVVDVDWMADIKWNFTKFLVNREGEVVKRWDSTSLPTHSMGACKLALSVAAIQSQWRMQLLR